MEDAFLDGKDGHDDEGKGKEDGAQTVLLDGRGASGAKRQKVAWKLGEQYKYRKIRECEMGV